MSTALRMDFVLRPTCHKNDHEQDVFVSSDRGHLVHDGSCNMNDQTKNPDVISFPKLQERDSQFSSEKLPCFLEFFCPIKKSENITVFFKDVRSGACLAQKRAS